MRCGEERPHHARQLCHPCYQLWWRSPNNIARPFTTTRGLACVNCGYRDGATLRRGRCQACYVYLWRHGADRPRWYWDPTAIRPPCSCCGLAPAQTRRGWCKVCYSYWKHAGRLRSPAHALRLAARRGDPLC